MELYPVMVQLEGRRVTVVGAGEVGLRKAGDLLSCGAQVRVIAPSVHAGFAGLAEDYGDQLEILQREYRAGDIIGSLLVFSATDDETVNRTVFVEARERSILMNAVDDPPNCSFIVPSSYRKGDLTLCISTGGASPAMAARLQRELQGHIPKDIDSMLEALNEARQLLKGSTSFAHLNTVSRGEILKTIVDDDARLEELRIAFERGSVESFLLGVLQAR
jgi:precorrin-2 dehydrogenase/sirohydrochlorin ferrochelatase